ncbi:unnamed protein product [Cyprideis torosa]|uniref:Uncharacterized protein n=1 Tax=Cyprideis torosa TaxID=163714 RepID=A0A7R8WJJ4_9CRUS|nr:unnamed protein product [Cyprideis torosa]CAG0900233.1 unnamed protein product [Cyprideis torosa]
MVYGEEELSVSITPHIYADDGDVVELDFICEGSREYGVCRWIIHDNAFTYELEDVNFDGNPLTCDFRITSERLESLLDAQDTHPSGEWRCTLHDAGGIFGSGTAQLTAAVTPKPPEIVPPEGISVREDEFAELTCTSARGRPGSNITWYIADTEGEIISPLEELAQCNITVEERDLDREIVDVISTVNCTFPPETNGRKLMCWADHPYATQLTVAVTPDPPQIDPPEGISVREDEFADLTCTSAKGRPGSSITWHIADTEGNIISPLEELAQCNITVEETLHDEEIVDVISTVNCTFPPETNGRKLMCWADHPYASQNFTSVDVNVEFVSLPYEIEGDVPPGFLSVEGDSYTFYAVPVGTRVELKVLFQASGLPSAVRWKSDSFGELESVSRNSKYESKPARLYSAEGEKGPEVDRTDVYVASLVIDPTSAKDFTVSYEFQVEDDVCIPGGNTPECMTIDFVITEGAKTVEAGRWGEGFSKVH